MFVRNRKKRKLKGGNDSWPSDSRVKFPFRSFGCYGGRRVSMDELILSADPIYSYPKSILEEEIGRGVVREKGRFASTSNRV